MTVVSQDYKIVLPYGKYIIKIVNQSDLTSLDVDYDDLIYPWFIIVLVGYDRVEILAKFSTEEKAITAMRNMVNDNCIGRDVFKFSKED